MRNRAGKVALIGCGRVAGHHCRWIRKTGAVELVAVCDLIEEKAIAYGKEFDVPHFTNYRTMLKAMPQIDSVAVVTPSGMHFEHAMEILEAYRKNIIVEKPTFMKPSEVVRAYALAKRNGVRVFPVFQNRNNVAVRRVKQAIESGELGAVRVVAVRLRWCRPQRYYDLSQWRGTFSHDGGALTNQGIHHVDLLRYLGGEVLQVNAAMATLGAKIEVEDTVVATMRCASGGVGVLEVTTAARPDDFEASISLVCEKGLAQIGGIAVNELQVFTPDRAECARHSEDFGGNVYGNGHGDVYRQIGEALNDGKPYPVDERDCLGSIKLLNSIYRADEAGNWVDVASESESPRLGRPDDRISNLYRTPVEKELVRGGQR